MKMRRFWAIIISITAAVACLAWAGTPALAWGPMTHMAINEQAYDQAAREMGTKLCIPADLRDEFIGGGPCPDIKFTAGASFPAEFHNDPNTVVRVIELAKTSSQYGLADVAMALGYAGHVYGEVWTAHADEGYPSNKVTLPLPNSGGLNHQVNELIIDLLIFRERARMQAHVGLAIPARLLSQAMKEEATRDPSRSAGISADRIRQAGVAFTKTVSGVRVIAEYLMRQRPDLLDEMDEFHGDRRQMIGDSIAQVVGLLHDYGQNDFKKSRKGTYDSYDNFFHIAKDAPLAGQAKSFFLNWLGKLVQNDSATDLFTLLGYGVVKGSLGTPFLKDKFLELAKKMGTASVWGDPRNKEVLARYTEGLLVREDLTYPEIIAYALEGSTVDPKALARQQEQFRKAGLTSTGRKPVTAARAAAAWQEVERIEAVNRTWPWFWPFRPGPQRAAEAREKAGRLLAFYFQDHPQLGIAPAKVEGLLQAARGMRKNLMLYKNVPWYNPLRMLSQRKQLTAASDEFLRQERFFAEAFQVLGQVAAGATTIAKLQAQTRQRLGETERSLAAVKAQLAATPAWRLPTRSRLKDEIARLETGVADLRQRLNILEELAAPPAAAGTAVPLALREGTDNSGEAADPTLAIEPEVAIPAGLTLEQAQANFGKAYAEYQALLKQPGSPEAEIRSRADAVHQAARVRDALQKKAAP